MGRGRQATAGHLGQPWVDQALSGLTIQQLGRYALAAGLAQGLSYRVGPFVFRVTSSVPTLCDTLSQIYPDYPLVKTPNIADAHVRVSRRGRFSGKEEVRYDHDVLLSDFPAGQGLPHVEWGLNWCVATRAHEYVQFHAAVLEREGFAILLPGLPGSGKSTLATFLAHRGWRLLSDEFALVRPGDRHVVPFPRLIPLKNESIDVVKNEIPAARIGPKFVGTRKGTVAHVCPPGEHIQRALEEARPVMVMYAGYCAGTSWQIRALSKSENFVRLTQNSFNYHLLGLTAFNLAAELATELSAFELQYGDAGEAVERITEMFSEVIAARREDAKSERPKPVLP